MGINQNMYNEKVWWTKLLFLPTPSFQAFFSPKFAQDGRPESLYTSTCYFRQLVITIIVSVHSFQNAIFHTAEVECAVSQASNIYKL